MNSPTLPRAGHLSDREAVVETARLLIEDHGVRGMRMAENFAASMQEIGDRKREQLWCQVVMAMRYLNGARAQTGN